MYSKSLTAIVWERIFDSVLIDRSLLRENSRRCACCAVCCELWKYDSVFWSSRMSVYKGRTW